MEVAPVHRVEARVEEAVEDVDYGGVQLCQPVFQDGELVCVGEVRRDG